MKIFLVKSIQNDLFAIQHLNCATINSWSCSEDTGRERLHWLPLAEISRQFLRRGSPPASSTLHSHTRQRGCTRQGKGAEPWAHRGLTKTQAYSLIEQLANLAWQDCPLVLSSSGLVLVYVVEAQWSPNQQFFWSKWVKNCTHYIHWHLLGKSIVIWSQEAAMAAGKMSLAGWPKVWEKWRTNRLKGIVQINLIGWIASIQ